VDLDDRVKTGNVHSVWWVLLRNSNFISPAPVTPLNGFFIATSEFKDLMGNYYYPIIKNKPSIRTSIDLAKSTAKTSDITLTCINEYLPSKLLSEELLYNGSTHYINQEVTIYQAFLGDASGDDTKIYTGRLIDIPHSSFLKLYLYLHHT